MIKADFLRTFSGKNLPFFQELRAKHPSAFVEVTMNYEEVVRGTHVEKILSISHRWMEPTQPDPDGEQLKAIKAFLVSSAGKRIELVWIDAGSMPQHQPTVGLIRSEQDTADFKTMLSQVCAALCLGQRTFPATQPPMLTPRPCSPPFTCAQVNMLYLGTTVLILYDLSYVSRFWTQFEAWLSMQFATPNGLKSAVDTKNARYHIVCIQGAAAQDELYRKALVDTWATKTPQQAFDFLSQPDVTVTNASDKRNQLPKIKALDATVQGAFQAIEAQLLQRVAASAGAVERAKAELQKGERECQEAKAREDAKVVPLAEAMARAEGEAAAARAAKEMHALAIKRGVMPMLMERQAAQKAWEATWPPGLKIEGGSLRGKATEYVGLYMLDGRLVNGRPAWKHTNGSCWIAFSGTSWIAQPEANLGQKLGFLMLTDAAAASPDASSATWQASAGSGSAWASQPALKCTIATAAELSAAQAAAALRAKEERRARAAAAREVSVKNFRGPCADRCKPLAPCCCVSADGEAIFGCVPTERSYFLPACLHMALCPQLGCDPLGSVEKLGGEGPRQVLYVTTLMTTLGLCCIQGNSAATSDDSSEAVCCVQVESFAFQQETDLRWYHLKDSNQHAIVPGERDSTPRTFPFGPGERDSYPQPFLLDQGRGTRFPNLSFWTRGEGLDPPSLSCCTRGEGLDPPAFCNARLGLRPALPLCDPTAQLGLLCPSRLLHPARCAQGLVLGVEKRRLDVALHGSAEVAASLPRTCEKRASPCERRRCLFGGVLFPPCMRHRRSACATSRGELPAQRMSRSASCRAA